MKGPDSFFCDRCKSLQEAEKVTLLKTLPRFLTVHLKRFKYDERIKGLSKITWQVAFPLQLKLKTVLQQPSVELRQQGGDLPVPFGGHNCAYRPRQQTRALYFHRANQQQMGTVQRRRH